MSVAFGISPPASNFSGDFSGWKLQSYSENEVSVRANAFQEIGNESQKQLHDKRVEITEEWKAVATTALGAIPTTIGSESVPGAGVLTSISISSTNNDFATMTLTGHKHSQLNATDGAMKSVSHGVSVSGQKGFGANYWGASGGESVESSTLTIECDHTEVMDKDGKTIKGENHNPRVTLSVTVLGAGVTAPAAFDTVSVTEDKSGTDFVRETGEFVKPLQFT